MPTNINALVWQYVQRDPAPSYESFLNLPTDGPTSTSERVKNFKNFLAWVSGLPNGLGERRF